jgi:hypothetical protein
MKKIKAYHCTAGKRSQTINATSSNKAKSQFCSNTGAKYTEVRTKKVPLDDNPRSFAKTAKDRSLPNARIGQLVSVDEKIGRITGSNGAANFTIEFKDGRIGVFHPGWQVEFLPEPKRSPSHPPSAKSLANIGKGRPPKHKTITIKLSQESKDYLHSCGNMAGEIERLILGSNGAAVVRSVVKGHKLNVRLSAKAFAAIEFAKNRSGFIEGLIWLAKKNSR